ncbi:MAG: hypothetical protein DBX55_02305 [Verrucomicrobia bacterium]|nr:MAG: hypothetical protein DBX55_02305 [Verrucomicrobiota bacterium]
MRKFFISARMLRIAASVAVFCLIGAQFFDIYHKLPKPYWIYNPTNMQFMPSLLEMLGGAGVLAGAAFVSFSACALIFGRAYCSCFCPFGILMDALRRISVAASKLPFLRATRAGKTLSSSENLRFAKAAVAVRAAFLTLACALIAAGFSGLLGFIDPYSLFGKIMGGFFRPALAETANAASAALAAREAYWLPAVDGNPAVSIWAFSLALAILALTWCASALRARLYCNTICPVGAWLGLLSKLSVFKIAIDANACVKCGLCERSCKAQCIDAKNGKLDFTRCVLCFNCAKKCRKNAVVVRLASPLAKLLKRPGSESANAAEADKAKKSKGAFGAKFAAGGNGAPNAKAFANAGGAFIAKASASGGDISSAILSAAADAPSTPNAPKGSRGKSSFAVSASRRKFAAALAAFAAWIPLGATGVNRRMRRRNRGEFKVDADASPFGVAGNRPDKRLGVPAGAQSLKNFSEKCTGCQICAAACKANILKPSLLEWGLSGLMQPYMDFTDGYCLYTCHACTKACPTGAIKFLSGREKKKVKIGTAKFKPSLCVVKTDGTDCAACAEHCPVQAIEMVPFNTERKSAQFIPHVHEEVCIGCGACEYICPVRPHRAIVVQGLSEHRKAKEWNDSMRIYKLPSRSAPANSAPAPAPDNPFPF